MSRYEIRYLTWQYFSLSGIRLTTGTWAFLSFRASRSPLVSSLPERMEVGRLLFFYLRIHNNSKAIFFVSHQYFARRIIRLDGPIIGADRQTRHNYTLGLNLTVHQQ